MTIFNIDERQVLDLLNPLVAPDDVGGTVTTREEAEPLFARVAWSTIAEPGDAVAGALIASAGPARSLEALLGDKPAVQLAELVNQATGEPGVVTPQALSAAVKRWKPRLASDRVLHALALAHHVQAQLLTPLHPLWPEALGDLGLHSPIVLWCRGGLEPDTFDRSLALVGARAASGYGEHVAAESAATLSDRGVTVVSGAAYGIDGACHRAVLAADGRTVAFLAGGIDRFYPAGHSNLLERITRSGAVLAEVPCGTPPSRWRFLQRNRLIAAASRATIVIEAGRRSGSLNTAGHAASLARPLGAVPGPVTSPGSAGCHRLMREFDATCVTTAAEMIELIDGFAADSPSKPQERRDPTEIRVLDALSTQRPRRPAEIAERAGLSLGEVYSALGRLDLEGAVREAGSGWRISVG